MYFAIRKFSENSNQYIASMIPWLNCRYPASPEFRCIDLEPNYFLKVTFSKIVQSQITKSLATFYEEKKGHRKFQYAVRFLLKIHTHTARDCCQLEKTSIFNNLKRGGNRQWREQDRLIKYTWLRTLYP